MTPVTLSHSEFVGACAEIARLTGRDPAAVAAGLAENVRVEAPAKDLTRFNLRAYCRDVAQLTATSGCTVSQAIAQLPTGDYDGVR